MVSYVDDIRTSSTDHSPADGTPATQVNKIVSHFTLPMIISAHEDRYIRLFDLATGESCRYSPDPNAP